MDRKRHFGETGSTVYTGQIGEASIERHVPADPLSIDRHHLGELTTLMGIYRLAFGQPRQEELLAAVRASKDLTAGDADQLAVDLSPPPFATS